MAAQAEYVGDEIDNVLSATYARHLPNRSGAVADYIPELAVVDPDRFGIAIATVNGRLYAAGDVNHPFTIQSVSKAFVYCLALELTSREAVLARVGVEPSGDRFNAIEFDPRSHLGEWRGDSPHRTLAEALVPGERRLDRISGDDPHQETGAGPGVAEVESGHRSRNVRQSTPFHRHVRRQRRDCPA